MPYIPSYPHSLFRPTTPLSDSKFTLNATGVAGFFGGDVAVSAMATVYINEGRKWLGFAALMERECDEMKSIEVPGREPWNTFGVTIVNLHHVPEYTWQLKQPRKYTSRFAFIPISVSIGTCVACAVFQDWYSFSMILLGILASGISCLVIGYGLVISHHPVPASGATRGDGFLLTRDNVIILIGEEGAVHSITRGKFSVNFSSERIYRYIGMCSLLLTVQFVTQLLLIPQGTLFGQIMFVASLAVSWGYNSWLSSLDKEEIQRKILLDKADSDEIYDGHTCLYGRLRSAGVKSIRSSRRAGQYSPKQYQIVEEVEINNSIEAT